MRVICGKLRVPDEQRARPVPGPGHPPAVSTADVPFLLRVRSPDFGPEHEAAGSRRHPYGRRHGLRTPTPNSKPAQQRATSQTGPGPGHPPAVSTADIPCLIQVGGRTSDPTRSRRQTAAIRLHQRHGLSTRTPNSKPRSNEHDADEPPCNRRRAPPTSGRRGLLELVGWISPPATMFFVDEAHTDGVLHRHRRGQGRPHR